MHNTSVSIDNVSTAPCSCTMKANPDTHSRFVNTLLARPGDRLDHRVSLLVPENHPPCSSWPFHITAWVKIQMHAASCPPISPAAGSSSSTAQPAINAKLPERLPYVFSHFVPFRVRRWSVRLKGFSFFTSKTLSLCRVHPHSKDAVETGRPEFECVTETMNEKIKVKIEERERATDGETVSARASAGVRFEKNKEKIHFIRSVY